MRGQWRVVRQFEMVEYKYLIRYYPYVCVLISAGALFVCLRVCVSLCICTCTCSHACTSVDVCARE